MYTKARERAEKQLDLAKFLRKQLMLDSMHKSMYSAFERFLIRNRNVYLIDSKP